MRTDDEVTAAAERTADLALKCARLTRERDEALAAVERVRAEIAHAEANDHRLDYFCQGVAPGEEVPAVRIDNLRAALGERP